MPRAFETVVLTAAAMTAFAANSVLTRMALGHQLMDAASFTTVRLAAGTVALLLLSRWAARAESAPSPKAAPSRIGPVALFAYAAPFSFAYLRIGAAVGSLVLFGSVQLTMVGCGLIRGERPGPRTFIGLVVACGGLATLTLPGTTRPDLVGSGLMVCAGAAWGIYSLAGRGTHRPLVASAHNFLWSMPFALILSLVTWGSARMSPLGFGLALVSGSVTSGLGYVIWYRALRGLAATQAAVVQLSVPVFASAGAVAFLGEPLRLRLIGSGTAVLGGVALALSARVRPPRTR